MWDRLTYGPLSSCLSCFVWRDSQIQTLIWKHSSTSMCSAQTKDWLKMPQKIEPSHCIAIVRESHLTSMTIKPSITRRSWSTSLWMTRDINSSLISKGLIKLHGTGKLMRGNKDGTLRLRKKLTGGSIKKKIARKPRGMSSRGLTLVMSWPGLIKNYLSIILRKKKGSLIVLKQDKKNPSADQCPNRYLREHHQPVSFLGISIKPIGMKWRRIFKGLGWLWTSMQTIKRSIRHLQDSKPPQHPLIPKRHHPLSKQEGNRLFRICIDDP